MKDKTYQSKEERNRAKSKPYRPDRILDYFRAEWSILAAVTVSGLIYNVGLLAGPWFEGKLAECLMQILTGERTYMTMVRLALGYVTAIGIVQLARYVKRFYVRRFANNINRRMKMTLYRALVQKSRAELEQEGAGNVMTKAISDVDDCVEGMRKFTTEIFDTGVALVCYVGMLLFYDWKLALVCMIFPPISYGIAERMKVVVQKTGAAYKEQTGKLNAATLDRITNAITYRVFGCEEERANSYETVLTDYEHAAVRANIWNTALSPLYKVISMGGVVLILSIGARNVLGMSETVWTIATFTTFLSCYTKLSEKSSKAAKLFNAVHKAQASWKRIFPYMERAGKMMEDEKTERVEKIEKSKKTEETPKTAQVGSAEDCDQLDKEKRETGASLWVEHLTFAYPGGENIFEDISFQAKPGQIIGVTGPVACGKSTLGKSFLCEYPYQGHIYYGTAEKKWDVSQMTKEERSQLIAYLGHDPELQGDSVKHNVLMGEDGNVWEWLSMVRLDHEIAEMESQEETFVGNRGVRLSGGQAARLALARTLFHAVGTKKHENEDIKVKPILLLDDPFSALDKQTERQIFEQIRGLSENMIVILFSHRLHLFPELDQVIWMNQKHAVCGDHETLMQEIPLYAELYRAQEGGDIHEAE